MARYIDADKFLKAQKDRCEGKVLIGNCTSNNNYLEYELEKYIEEDVQPVIHAKWMDRKDYHSCSNCGAVLEEDYKWHYHAYCYHCGARMNAE